MKHSPFLLALVIFEAIAVAEPKPLSGFVSQQWEGDDGPWSTMTFAVGSPAQYVRLLVSMAGQETWVVSEDYGCVNNTQADCSTKRGTLFSKQNSTSWVSTTTIWKNSGWYPLGNYIGDLLGIGGIGEYGFDTVALLNGPSVTHTIVSDMYDTDYYIGQFGISPRGTNFTATSGNSSDLSDPQPSYLWLLKNQSIIPSLSWGFNPGSYWRSQSIQDAFSSLTLGGYDKNKMGDATKTFTMGPDSGRELIVGLQEISKMDGSSQSVLLSIPIFAALDSSQPYMWLPMDVCQLFEKAFGLTWNSTAEMYLMDDTQHANLLKENATVTFKIAANLTGTDTMEIVLPYGSLGLTATYPLVSQDRPYFPLKRADNSTQYALGRAFLQEVYIVADYERVRFSVSTMSWLSNPGSDLVPILPVSDEGGSRKLGIGAIVGIAVGGVAVLLILAFGIWMYLRHQKKKKREQSKSQPLEKAATQERPPYDDTKKPAIPEELDSYKTCGIAQLDSDHSPQPHELQGQSILAELDGRHYAELPDDRR